MKNDVIGVDAKYLTLALVLITVIAVAVNAIFIVIITNILLAEYLILNKPVSQSCAVRTSGLFDGQHVM